MKPPLIPNQKKKKTILIGYILVCISGGDYSWLQLFFFILFKKKLLIP